MEIKYRGRDVVQLGFLTLPYRALGVGNAIHVPPAAYRYLRESDETEINKVMGQFEIIELDPERLRERFHADQAKRNGWAAVDGTLYSKELQQKVRDVYA